MKHRPAKPPETPDLALDVRLDQDAPPGNVLPALARLLRQVARRERERGRSAAKAEKVERHLT
jgi:hypothetical protein